MNKSINLPPPQHRIAVVDAINEVAKLISLNETIPIHPTEVQIFVEVAIDNGGNEFHPDEGQLEIKAIGGKEQALTNLREKFLQFCKSTGTQPRNLLDPWGNAYTGEFVADDYTHTITVGEFNEWVNLYNCAILSAGPSAITETQSAKAASPHGIAMGDDWKELARKIADECFDNDTNGNPPTRDCLIRFNKRKDAVGGYAVRVMEIMQERKIHGPRGLITNAKTIAREALQGQKWWGTKSK